MSRPAPRQAAPVSRRVLLTFLGVATLLCAELGWWVTFHVRASQAQRHIAVERLERDLVLAQSLVLAGARGTRAPTFMRGPTPSNGSDPAWRAMLIQPLELPPRATQSLFAGLQWVLAPRPAAPRTAAAVWDLTGGWVLELAPETLAGIARAHRAHTRMFLAEGGFFLAMLGVGVGLIHRTLRREVGVMRQQANFLAAVSHELKSPIASLRLYVETMQMRRPDAAGARRYLKIMRIDIDRLWALVGNLLVVARLDRGDVEARPVCLDLVAALRRIVAEARAHMLARGAPLHLTAPRTPLYAELDPDVLATSLRNVFDNAAKYNQSGARIDVTVQAIGQKVFIRVTDRGIGLRAQEQKRIFKKFYRVGDEMVRQTEGSGLGLYLVRALWQQGGGRVWATSPGLGMGTSIVLTTRRCSTPRERPAPASARFDSRRRRTA